MWELGSSKLTETVLRHGITSLRFGNWNCYRAFVYIFNFMSSETLQRQPNHYRVDRICSFNSFDMQNEGDLIAPALFSDFDGKEESVEELFLDDGSSAVLEGLIESKSKIELISPEDLAWVDSCLVADPQLSMESWVSLKEALLDSITTFVDSYEETNATGTDAEGKGEEMEVDEKEVVGQPEADNDEGDAAHVPVLVNCTEEDDRDDDDDGDGEEEIQKEIESPESIFMVWNLHEEREEKEHELIPELTRAVADLQVVKEEDDQFLTDLKQAVAESILRENQREVTDEASTAEDAMLHELISSMGDLSLKPSFK